MKTILTIIVPTHGDTQSLAELRSWASELDKFNGFLKLIIVFDETETIKSFENFDEISRFKSKYLEIIHGHFGSPGTARNKGLIKSSSEWVMFCDVDDIPDCDKILQLVNQAISKKVEVAIGSFRVRNLQNHSTVNYVFESEHLRRNFKMVSQNPGIWRFILKRDGLTSLEFTNLRMGEDQLFLMQYLAAKRTILFSSEIIYTYHKGVNGQLTSEKKATSEIVKCLPQSRLILREAIRNNSNCVYLLSRMYMKQSLSGVIHGVSAEKFISTIHLLNSSIISLIFIKSFRLGS